MGITSLTPAVRVMTYYPNVDEPFTDAIILGHHVEDENEPAALGQGRYEETVRVSSEIRVVRAGAGEAVSQTARDRAMNLLGEIDNQLRTALPAVGAQTISALVARREMDQFAYIADTTPVRVCFIEFDIVYVARTAKES